MSTSEFGWRWQMHAGRYRLVLDNEDAYIIMRPGHDINFMTRSEDGGFQNLSPTDTVAKIIAAAPDVRRHAQGLIHGIDIGLVRIVPTEHGDRESLGNVLTELRIALGKSGAV